MEFRKKSNEETISSIAKSRGRGQLGSMGSGNHLMATSYRTIAEEMPDAHKDVNMVVEAVQEAGLANKLIGLKPYLVVKG